MKVHYVIEGTYEKYDTYDEALKSATLKVGKYLTTRAIYVAVGYVEPKLPDVNVVKF